MFSLANYHEHHHRVLTLFRRAGAWFKEEQLTASAEQLGILSKQVRDERFRIAVVGEYNRGKSTFINSLLGKRILPMKQRETTAYITYIQYAAHPYYRATLSNRRKRDYTLQEWQSLIVPRSQEEKTYNEREISDLQVGYPLDICQQGVTLIDTPGLNGMTPQLEQRTHKIIERADTIIIVLNAIQPITAQEIQLLREKVKRAQVQQLFFVINAKDLLKTKEEQREVYERVQQYVKEFAIKPAIYLMSAKMALQLRDEVEQKRPSRYQAQRQEWTLEETGILQLERDLSHFLTTERGRVKLMRPLLHLQHIVEQDGVIPFTHYLEQWKDKVANGEQILSTLEERLTNWVTNEALRIV